MRDGQPRDPRGRWANGGRDDGGIELGAARSRELDWALAEAALTGRGKVYVARAGGHVIDAWCPDEDTGLLVGARGALRDWEAEDLHPGTDIVAEDAEQLSQGRDLTEARSDVMQFHRERARSVDDATELVDGSGLVERTVERCGDRLVVESHFDVDDAWSDYVSRRWSMRKDGGGWVRSESYPAWMGRALALSHEEREVDRRIEAEAREARGDLAAWGAQQDRLVAESDVPDPEGFNRFVGRVGTRVPVRELARAWREDRAGDAGIWERVGLGDDLRVLAHRPWAV